MTTITQEQFEAASRAYRVSGNPDPLMGAFIAAGITITPAEPPEAMVKLAEDFARKAWMSAQGDPGRAAKISSLLTLQHAVGVVKVQPVRGRSSGESLVAVEEILTALGAGDRDAG
jgi:hypothetical protein